MVTLDPRGDHQAPLPHPTLEIMTCVIAVGMGLRRKGPCLLMWLASRNGMASALVVCMAGRFP